MGKVYPTSPEKLHPVTRPGPGGFTLVEILLGLAILVLLAVIVLGGMSSFRETAALDQALDEAAELLRQARSKTLASENAIVHGVHFASSTLTLVSGGVYTPTDSSNVVVVLPHRVEISAISLSTTTGTVMFERLTGQALATGIVTFSTTSANPKIRRIQILPSGIFFEL